MKSFEDLINDGIDNKVAELFPDLVIKKGLEFISIHGMHCVITGLSKNNEKVRLYDLDDKFPFTIGYDDLRKALTNPKVKILNAG